MTSKQEIEKKTYVGGFKTAADGTEELVEITMAEMRERGYENPDEYLKAEGLRGVTREDRWRMPKPDETSEEERLANSYWTNTGGGEGFNWEDNYGLSSRPTNLKPPEGMS